MLDLCDEIILGIDRRGKNIYLEDFRRNFAILKTCKKITAEGRELIKQNKFYRNNERKFSDEDIKKIRGIE